MGLGSHREAIGILGTASIEVVVDLDDVPPAGRGREIQERVEAVGIPIAQQLSTGGVAERQGRIHLGVQPLGQHVQDDALSLLGLECVIVGGAFITVAVDGHTQGNPPGLCQRVIALLREHLFLIPDHEGSSIGDPEVPGHAQLVDPRGHVGGDGHLELAGNGAWSRLQPGALAHQRGTADSRVGEEEAVHAVHVVARDGDLNGRGRFPSGGKSRHEPQKGHLAPSGNARHLPEAGGSQQHQRH